MVAWTGTVVNIFFLWLFHGHLEIPVLIASAMAIEIAILNNYTLNYFITWRDKVTPSIGGYFRLLIRFNIIIASIDFVIRLSILYALVNFVGVNYLIADMIGMLITPFVKFTANHSIIFQETAHENVKSANKYG